MNTPINLNKARKARARTDRKVRADANSVKFGRTKAERTLDAVREEKANAKLTQLKFDDD